MLILRPLNKSNFSSRNHLLSQDCTSGKRHHGIAEGHQSIGLSLHLQIKKYSCFSKTKKKTNLRAICKVERKRLIYHATCRCNSRLYLLQLKITLTTQGKYRITTHMISTLIKQLGFCFFPSLLLHSGLKHSTF